MAGKPIWADFANIQVFDWPGKTDKVRPPVYPSTVMIQGNLDKFRRGYAKIFTELEESLTSELRLSSVFGRLQ
jgi:hypothetical protein